MNSTIARQLVGSLLALLLILAPVTPASSQEPEKTMPGQTQPAQPSFSLGLAKYNFSRGPSAFPNLTRPYRPIQVAPIEFTNSPQLEQLIHDGKLELSLQAAIELALANNVDIAVQRYNPWIADTSILRALGGGSAGSLSGGAISGGSFGLGSIPALNFDPTVTTSLSFDTRSTPISNPFIAGVGTTSLTSLSSHTAQFNTQYSQGFHTGTGIAVTWDNSRSSNTSPSNIFNPAVQSSLYFSISQQLLNGFGLLPNTRNIRIAKNNRKISEWQFTQQAITTVTNTIVAYWELVYARENVKVEQRAVEVSEKLYSDNKKQLEIGTMAPLDVTRAESELATDQQNLIVAQTVQLQDQQALKNLISRDPLVPGVIEVEIVPTDTPTQDVQVEMSSFENAVKEAFAKRPELQAQAISLQNADINVRATRNALLPIATLSAQYGTVGLSGDTAILGTPTIAADLGVPVVDQNGVPVTVPVPIFVSESVPNVLGIQKGGFGGAMSQIFHNQFPDYAVQLNLTIPIRNRQAQADNQLAQLTRRQAEAQLQQLKNAAILDVRNTFVAFQQDRARVEAAVKARVLQQQTFDAEQKKYQLGASTVYLVIQTQRDLVAAQGTELRALADLAEAKANFERALARTLDVNHVTVADAKSGVPERDTLIPGTLHGQVIGTDTRGPAF
ncbi:MAG: TolC family protein [Candidatus Acidiferrales bacterium]|jgi:outer membrane protein TolC